MLFRKIPISYKAMIVTMIAFCASFIIVSLINTGYVVGAFNSGRVFDVKDWLIVFNVFPAFFTTGIFIAVVYDLLKNPHREE